MELREFFIKYPRVAIGFSGGVDSSFLLREALLYAEDVRAYYVSTAFQPAFELRDAVRTAELLGTELTVLNLDILACEEVTANPPDRCYYCKNRIFDAIRRRAAADGYSILLDGTNASDDAADRPGMRALKELAVLSPLRICGLTKEEIRKRSKEAGLFTWNKPAYACLATRTPSGERLTSGILERTERAESALSELGFCDFRVRHRQDTALIEVTERQSHLLSDRRQEIISILRECGYRDVIFSSVPRRPSV